MGESAWSGVHPKTAIEKMMTVLERRTHVTNGLKQAEYEMELKLAAVRRVLAGASVGAVAQELGIRRKRLYVWKDRYAELGKAGLVHRRGGRTRKEVPVAEDGTEAMRIEHLAEREGFEYRHFLQVAVKTRHSDNSLCLYGFQAHFQLPVCCLRRLSTASIDHENGITGISSEWWRVKVSLSDFFAVSVVSPNVPDGGGLSN